MKKNILFVLITIALCCIIGVASGCKRNECEGISCQNGGTCSSGNCNCPTGYTGRFCELTLDACQRKGCNSANTDTCLSEGNTEARCICKTGFEGKICDSTWAQKFFGSYTASESCNGILGSYAVQVKAGTKYATTIEITNFHNATTPTQSSRLIVNVVGRNDLQIDSQPMPYGFVSGYGFRSDNGNISLDYTLVDLITKDTTRCNMLLQP